MNPYDAREAALIEASRMQRETLDLPLAVRLRFADHAESVGRYDVARDMLAQPAGRGL